MEVRTSVIFSDDEYQKLKKRSQELELSVSRFLRYLFNAYGHKELSKQKSRSQQNMIGKIQNRSLKKMAREFPNYAGVKVFSSMDSGINFISLSDGVYTIHNKKTGVYKHSVSGGGFCYTKKRYFNPQNNETVEHKARKKYPYELFFYNKNGRLMAVIMYGENFDYSNESFKKIIHHED